MAIDYGWELERNELVHNLWSAYMKQAQRLDVLVLLVVFLAQTIVCFSFVFNYEDGFSFGMILNIATTALNVFNAVYTIKRMIERRSDMKEEQELYELARQELLELCELEEDDWEVELE